jgi:hypothetical protein
MSDKIKNKKVNLREEMLRAIKYNPNISSRFNNAALVGKIQGCRKNLLLTLNNRLMKKLLS